MFLTATTKEIMLKIKDSVDLKELEKFGFEVVGNFAKKIFYLGNQML